MWYSLKFNDLGEWMLANKYPRRLVSESEVVEAGGRHIEDDAVVEDDASASKLHVTKTSRSTTHTTAPAHELRKAFR